MCNHRRMEPDGDPEARIRDLERPLAQQAHASELGTRPYEAGPSAGVPVPPYRYEDHQHSVPPPPWPPPYGASTPDPAYPAGPQWGSPYHAPPQHVVRKRSRALWLVPLVVAGGVLIGVMASIGFFAADDAGPRSYTPTPPTVAGGGGPLDPPRADPGAPRTPAPDVVDTVGAGESLSVAGIDQNRSVRCAGGAVSVSGMGNTVQISGDCAVVTVSGFENVVTVESAQSITASGFDNRVTYSTGAPQIANSGRGNVVEAG